MWSWTIFDYTWANSIELTAVLPADARVQIDQPIVLIPMGIMYYWYELLEFLFPRWSIFCIEQNFRCSRIAFGIELYSWFRTFEFN